MILAGAGAVLLLIVCVPLMTMTMRDTGVNCGTVFAGSDTWTYSSSFDASDSSYYEGARTNADFEAGAEAAANDLFADIEAGAAAFDYCETVHSDRRVLLISLGVSALLLGVIAVWARVNYRRSDNSLNGPM